MTTTAAATPSALLGWLDLVSTDIECSCEFLGELFAWHRFERVQLDGIDYRILGEGGVPILGAEQIRPDQVPSRWTLFVVTDHIVGLLQRVLDAGGALSYPATRLDEFGTIAMITDPAGSTLGVWEARSLVPGSLHANVAPLVGARLTSPDPHATIEFLHQTFAWELTSAAGSAAEVVGTLSTGGAFAQVTAGGRGEWVPIFGLNRDLTGGQATAERIVALGGTCAEASGGLWRATEPLGAEFLLTCSTQS